MTQTPERLTEAELDELEKLLLSPNSLEDGGSAWQGAILALIAQARQSSAPDDGWKLIKDAPLSVSGHLWSPEVPDRTDIIGQVYAYSDGGRGTTSPSSGIEFTHWRPLPAPPSSQDKEPV